MQTIIENQQDGLLVALLYYTGLRRGEALGLRWSDINFAARTLRVEETSTLSPATLEPSKQQRLCEPYRFRTR